MKKWRLVAMTAMIVTAVVLNVATPALKVDALPGGVPLETGYFTDSSISWVGTHAVILRCGGDALSSAMTDKQTFIDTIMSYYDGSGSRCNQARNKTGAEFIIQTMRGVRPSVGSPRLTQADIDDWKARVNNPNVAISWENIIFSYNSAYSDLNDDIFYLARQSSHLGLVFKDLSGNVLYQLKSNCANPIGDLGGLPGIPEPTPNDWTISASSTANINGVAVSSAKPGDLIQWTHTLTNNGPDATTANVHSNLALTGFSNGWGAGPGEWAADDTGSGAGVGTIRTIISYATYGVEQADVGNTLCEKIQYDPTNGTGGRDGRGNDSCVSVPYNYTLTPSVTTDHSGVIEPSTSLNVTPTVNNTGPTKSQSTQWQVTQIVVAPGQAVPNAAGGTSPAAITPCGTYFRALPNAICSTINSGTSVFDTNGNVLSGNPLTMSPVVIGDLAVGTKICFAFSVQPSSNSSDAWTHSAPTCLIIGKKPKLQILGGDLISGGSVNTSTTNKNISGTNYTFGSWIEYGIFAVGTITGAGSGSAYAGSGMPTTTFCNASLLSFTNAGSSTCLPTTTIGKYTNASSMPDVASSFPATGAPTIGGGDLADQAKTGIFTSGNVTLTGGTIQKGRWLVINAPTVDITIDGNIVYFPGVMQSISDIPQVVIIANNINITAKVTQVDAWLIAKGSLNTCSDVAGNLSATLCSQSLVVNGPVMAGKMILRRTAGSGTGANSGDPAEVFNLRPDAYLWASARATGSGRIQTAYTTELPPRL